MEPTAQTRLDLAFEEWLAADPRFAHLDAVTTVARLDVSRRDLRGAAVSGSARS